MLLINY